MKLRLLMVAVLVTVVCSPLWAAWPMIQDNDEQTQVYGGLVNGAIAESQKALDAGDTAKAYDASTVWSNPAGMVRLNWNEIDAAANLILANSKFSGGNSIGVYVKDSDLSLAIRNCRIVGGSGGDGLWQGSVPAGRSHVRRLSGGRRLASP